MTDGYGICAECGHDRDAHYPNTGGCQSCTFAYWGDMCTLHELRRAAPLADPEMEAARQEYVSRIEAAGLDEDIDPSSFTVTLTGTPEGLVMTDWQPVRVPPSDEEAEA